MDDGPRNLIVMVILRDYDRGLLCNSRGLTMSNISN